MRNSFEQNKPEEESLEVKALAKEVSSFGAFVGNEIKTMRLDPDEVESRYNKIKREYETKKVEPENKEAFEKQMSYLDSWISSYRQNQEELLTRITESVSLINGELLSHASFVLQKIQYLEQDRMIGDRLLENKVGLWQLISIIESITPSNFKVEEIAQNLSGIKELCDFDFNVNPEEFSPQQADYTRYFANEAVKSLEYLADGLKKVALSFDKIEIEGYSEIVSAFKKLSEIAMDAAGNLNGMSRKLEF